eukprot:10147621-Heterocapsa_arctica.AAC.1
MGNMVSKMEEMEGTHEATKRIMQIGFTDTEKSILAQHEYVRERFSNIEEDVGRVKYLVKDLINKKKNNDEEEDREEQDLPESDDEEPMVGAQHNDMNRFQKNEIYKWLENNPDRKADAMLISDKTLMADKAQ